jgi:CBS domain-containing protein
MARTVAEIMTVAPTTVQSGDPVRDAASAMRDHDVGALLVVDAGDLAGIVTDRDIAVRAVAEGRDPATTTVGEVASTNPAAVESSSSADDAAELMRDRALRRLPVTEDGRPVGVVSLGDLAVERDPDSVLADVSASDPNR